MTYFGLRLYNTVLGMAWGFGLTWVMVRALGVEGYAPYVFTASLGLYLAVSDLGTSRLLYALLRGEYVTQAAEGARISRAASKVVPSAIILFLAISGIAIVLYTAIVAFAGGDRAGLVLFFAGVTLYLPWNNVRAVLEATEQQVFYESLDAVRRTLQFLSIFAIPMGGAPAVVFAFHLLLWGAVLAAALVRVQRVVRIRRWWWGIRGQRAFFAYLRGKLSATIAFSFSEMWIYNGAYLMIPLLFASPSALVLYDVFNKMVRAAMSLNIVLSTSSLPKLTRDWHEGAHGAFFAQFRRLLGLSLVAMAVLAGLLWGWGDVLVSELLDGQAEMPATMIAAIILIALANALQNSIGSIIVALGYAQTAHLLALAMALLMAGLYGVSWSAGIVFQVWILGFALVYLVGALLWTGIGLRILVQKSKNSQ